MILKLRQTPGLYLVGFMGSGKTTIGKLLADRAFSRLLREDWPRTLEELEMKMGKKKGLPPRPDRG